MADLATHLDVLVEGQTQTRTAINELLDPMSSAALFGRRASTSAGLAWGYYGGTYTNGAGALVDILNGTLTLSASSTIYIECDSTGSVSQNTTGFSVGHIPLYTVTTGAATVSNYIDHRDGTQGNYLLRAFHRRVATPSWSSSMALDWSSADIIRVTLAGNTAFTFSGAVDGQSCILELTQDGTGSRLVTFPSNVRLGADFSAITLSTAAGKMDRHGFVYHQPSGKYDLVALSKGF